MKRLSALVYTAVMATRPQADPAATEVWSPVPPMVRPGDSGEPPSDAVVLFDRNDLSEWRGAKGEAGWKVGGDAFTVVPGTGNLRTRRSFGDLQLHIEWRAPSEVRGEGQDRGNSGVFLMERYEIQILDSYENETYVNGQAAAIYKQHPPLVNASRPPGVWQSFDVLFTAPRFEADGGLDQPARFTLFHNGILVQNHVEVKGTTTNRGEPRYERHPDRAPLMLQDHGSPVSFRNVWIREL